MFDRNNTLIVICHSGIWQGYYGPFATERAAQDFIDLQAREDNYRYEIAALYPPEEK